MNVQSIVTDWLLANGYDGLYNGDCKCGCDTEDLMPCDNPCALYCKAGYKSFPDLSENKNNFTIGAKKHNAREQD